MKTNRKKKSNNAQTKYRSGDAELSKVPATEGSGQVATTRVFSSHQPHLLVKGYLSPCCAKRVTCKTR